MSLGALVRVLTQEPPPEGSHVFEIGQILEAALCHKSSVQICADYSLEDASAVAHWACTEGLEAVVTNLPRSYAVRVDLTVPGAFGM